jgi:hypothetical protein
MVSLDIKFVEFLKNDTVGFTSNPKNIFSNGYPVVE